MNLDDDENADRSNPFVTRLLAVYRAREKMTPLDAQRILNKSKVSVVRTGASTTFKLGDMVSCWDTIEKTWKHGHRFLADIGRNGLVELGSKIKKLPRQWIQHHREDGTILPENSIASTPANKKLVVGKEMHEVDSSDDLPIRKDPARRYHLRPNEPSSSSMVPAEDVFFNLKLMEDYESILSDTHGTWLNCESMSEECLWSSRKKQSEMSKEDTLDEASLEGMDPARLPPKVFTSLRQSRNAIREEIFGLLRPAAGGIPPAKLVKIQSPLYRSVPRLRTTLIVKIKAGNRHKARVCLRGDTQPPHSGGIRECSDGV